MSDVILHLQTLEGAETRVMSGNRLSIGRGEEADWRVDDYNLSEIHAVIYREGKNVWIEDRLSANGSCVNGKPVLLGGMPLNDDNEIILGRDTTIRVNFRRESGFAPAPPTQARANAATTPLRITGLSVLFLAVLIGGAYVVRALVGGNGTVKIDPTGSPTPEETSIPTLQFTPSVVPTKLYRDMSEDEKISFINQKARLVSNKISNSEQPYDFTEAVILLIKKYLDSYGARVGNGLIESESSAGCDGLERLGVSRKYLWKEDLGSLLSRARCYAPTVIRAFNDPQHKAPPAVGLYLVMIESEYHRCLESPVGARGMFQFMPKTAELYGVRNEDAMCRPEVMAAAAARYIADRRGQFGTDKMSVTLAIAGYNRGPGSITKDLQKVLSQDEADVELKLVKGNERGFWSLVEGSSKLDKYFNGENIKYVPKFFAAAIVGENPRAFGVDMDPLSLSTVVGPPPPASDPPTLTQGDCVSKAAIRAMTQIGNERDYSFPILNGISIRDQINGLAAQYRFSSSLPGILANSGGLSSRANAKGVKPSILIYSALAATEGGQRGDPVKAADAMLDELHRIQIDIGIEKPDSALLVIAAYKLGFRSDNYNRFKSRMEKLNDADKERHIWRYHETKALPEDAYQFAMKALTLGAIAQNPQCFEINAQAVNFRN